MSASVRRRRWIVSALGRSPLVRGFDRLEAVARLIALTAAVIAIPVAVLAGGAAYSADLEQRAHDARTRNSVEASVTRVDVNPQTRAPLVSRRVSVRWSSAFEERVGSFSTNEQVGVGDTVTVWLDEAGEMTDPPDTVADVQGAAIGTGIAVWLGTALTCLAAVSAVHLALNRRRYASWDHQWWLLSTNGGGWANRDH